MVSRIWRYVVEMRALIAVTALTLPSLLYAGSDGYSPGEMARISEYCPDTQTFNTTGFPENPAPSQRRWVALMGKTFWAIHHYCWAQLAANRAALPGTSAQARQGLLQSAINDIRYVLRNSTPDFVLLPELYTRIGDYYQQLNQPGDALPAYEQAIAVKVDYWPPYVRKSQVLLCLGRRSQAEQVLRDALKLMPGQPQVAQALQELGSSSKQSERSSTHTSVECR